MRHALYTTLLRLAVPVLLARLVRRARASGVPSVRWREWLGWGEPLPPGAIWLHAASVGEVEAALPLARVLQEKHPGRHLLVTTTTPEGAMRVTAALGDAVSHRFLPLDLPGAVRRFLHRARPAVAVMLETELWPNLYRGCERAGVPLLLTSARMSPRSSRRYRRLQPLVAETLARLEVLLAQDESAARAFLDLGAPAERVRVGGNLKFDRELPPGHEQGAAFRQGFAGVAPVWVAMSTREGEDAAVLSIHRLLRAEFPDAVLVWVPRHRERFEPAFEAARAAGFRTGRRSDGPTGPVDVLIGDSIGEVGLYLGAGDAAFVGGSLVPLGGQNVLEPAALGLPVVTGPSTEHFESVVARMEAVGALHRAQDAQGVAHELARLLKSPDARRAMGEAGRGVLDSGRGAVGEAVRAIEHCLERGRAN
ncbi:3-deoxy-D-manno-octulosonic acid transferase [Thioalkalivibrio sp. ALMg11]|uniref:3-deoxy-D-manno-octulosonic acid transferase n=1 Tax=Thioalkalivibrio sp. ALMg11 TaxID=1158165 RepID=UPI00037805B7|nr:3-deoxy-D-manno-octulosonic acid transferase [Thioalkalivibrio sp. ALMg11]